MLAEGAPELDEDPPSAEDVRAAAEGLAASEEDLVLLAMFGDEAETLLQTIRTRHSREATLLVGDVTSRGRSGSASSVRIVQESGVGEIEIEDEGMRVSVRRADETTARPAGAPLALAPEPDTPVAAEPAANGLARVESPMVGTFYRAPQPGAPPYVAVGDVVVVGQTLCVLEAMKLMNEVKAGARRHRAGHPRRERTAGRVRPAAVRDRAGHRTASRLVMFSASSSPTGARSPSA